MKSDARQDRFPHEILRRYNNLATLFLRDAADVVGEQKLRGNFAFCLDGKVRLTYQEGNPNTLHRFAAEFPTVCRNAGHPDCQGQFGGKTFRASIMTSYPTVLAVDFNQGQLTTPGDCGRPKGKKLGNNLRIGNIGSFIHQRVVGAEQ